MKRNGFVNLVIIFVLLLGLVAVSIYLITKNGPKPSQNQGVTPTPITTETNDFDLGLPTDPPNKIILVDMKDSKLLYFDTEGNLLAKCGDNTTGVRDIVAPDLKKVIYTKNDDPVDLFLDSGNCDSEKTVFSIDKEVTEKYGRVVINPEGWSEDSSQFFFTIVYLSPTLLETYLYDLTKDESIKILSLNDLKDEQSYYKFVGWPKGYQNPIFVHDQGNDEKDLYEFNLNSKQFEQIGKATFGHTTNFRFLSKNTILWVDNLPETTSPYRSFSRIMLSTFDRSKEETITPDSGWGYGLPRISPDKKKIAYQRRQVDTKSTAMVYEVSSKKTYDLGVDINPFKWVDNNRVLYEEDNNVYSFNINTKESKLFAKDTNILFE